MNTLIIGGDSFVGKALYERIGGQVTSRRNGASIHFDLNDPPENLPNAQVVYLVAAKTKFRDCELDKDAWSVNVDAPIRIASWFYGAFIVYLSSEAATWANQTAYGSQKRAAEMGLLSVLGYSHLAVVRPSKIEPSRIGSLIDLLETVGKNNLCGVHTWR